MKKFLLKLVWYFTPIFLLIIIFSFVINFMIGKKIQAFKLEKQKKVLIAGDSHTAFSLNPELINNSINLAQSGECYFYTFYKIKYLLNQPNYFKFIIIGCSYSNFNSFWDEYLYKEDKIIPMLERYYLTIDLNGYYLISGQRCSYKYLLGNLGFPIKNNVDFIKSENPIFFNQFEELTGNNLSDTIINASINNTFYLNGKLREMSSIQLEYLEKIINLCQAKKKTLILLNTPTYLPYHQFVPEKIKLEFENSIKYLIKKHNIQFWDYSYTKIIPRSGYFDPTHLNKYGANTFSKRIDKELRK
jgi:hypothetical protein